ncbi:MAG: hypothetical protein P8J86_02635 [Phycisphaerales bacterium]|nr:hypothetical protein [Phycisphaerales bacterium]
MNQIPRTLLLLAISWLACFFLNACAPTYVPMKIKIREITTKKPIADTPVAVRQNQLFLPFPPFRTLPFSLTTFQRPGNTAYGITNSQGFIAFDQVTIGPAQIIITDKQGHIQIFYADHAIENTWTPMSGSTLPHRYELQIIEEADRNEQTQSPAAEVASPVSETPSQQLTVPPTGW